MQTGSAVTDSSSKTIIGITSVSELAIGQYINVPCISYRRRIVGFCVKDFSRLTSVRLETVVLEILKYCFRNFRKRYLEIMGHDV